ncbi:hypothetical protein KIN20_033096 [Parelaphostrongylus tenuis]|uniref:RNase NYN domain-containing protein n=1 Tax=Parelaphostrongylus tenuis TaxID=148309 RepID=A0AAD5R812_PARTN|nr:hypothetical protein KIN20_033096 [Parelaphostrongylus tenuis]
MPWRYGVKCSETNKRAINKLEEMGMACLTDAHIHDDIAMLEMALTTDGVVVSNDKFRDHMKFSPRFKKVIDRSVSVKISEIEITNLDKCVSFFQQRTAPRGFPSLTLHDSFFSTLDNIRHVIVKGTRRYWTEKYRDKTLKTIDELFKRVWEEESELFKNRVKTG